MSGKMQHRRDERVVEWILRVTAGTTVLLLIGIFAFLLLTSLRAFADIDVAAFLLGSNWNPSAYGEPTWGILSLLTGTLMVSLLSMAIAVPLGLASAIYLSEVASPPVRETLKPLIELIAGIPSVVLGLLGLLYLAPLLAMGLQFLGGRSFAKDAFGLKFSAR